MDLGESCSYRNQVQIVEELAVRKVLGIARLDRCTAICDPAHYTDNLGKILPCRSMLQTSMC